MIQVRKAEERGHANHGWLDTYHTFSFASYYDEEHMGFRALRVINDDTVQGGKGFGTHAHSDMEIISYVLEGGLQHQDSMGNGSVLEPGDVQRISAGRGILHSEFNASQTEPVHFLQIWIEPDKRGVSPSYEEKRFPREEKLNKLRLIASPDARDGSVWINQDVNVYASILENGKSVTMELDGGRHGWIQVASGRIMLGDRELKAGDGVAVSSELNIKITAVDEAEFLVFDLA
jgi:redox-sensitive bicupin YhaK (pirin superfamily)